ncbi:MAG: ABC transporter ATP-binding protein [Candidatus Poribacteria bacterium]|nr:MAG: ABC transporter ATP-binding protein [Candidatus Poribacteria bacterium]
MSREPLLRVENLKTYFRTPEGVARAVDGVSFEISPGETFALVGESGCGKSVTALSIMQLVPQPAGYHAGGEVWLDGREITRLPEPEKRRLRGSVVAMIFQDPMSALNPVFTVGFQLTEAIRAHRRVSRREAWRLAVELLRSVHLPDPQERMQAYPHQLSGGMKQRVMIAMALAAEPKLLIADEPTTALDVTVQAQILDLIAELQARLGMAVLLITHDLGIVREQADRVAVMYAGKIVEETTTERLFERPSHPYTQGLFASLPSMQKRGYRLSAIPGAVPSATRYPEGCRFAGRCPAAMERCHLEEPPLLSLEENHRAACWLHAATSEEAVIKPTAGPLFVQTLQPIQANNSPETTPLVRVEGLKTWFPIRRGLLRRTVAYVRAVDGVSLSVPRGKTLAIVGESGCGKTTLGKSILRLVEPTAGRVWFDGEELTQLPRRALNRRRGRFQIVFQDPYASLDPRMRVGEILTEGMKAQRRGGRTDAERMERARQLLDRVGLDGSAVDRYPHEFSGGQRQRIAIARALAVEPEFLVCDEPTSALDVSVQAQILNLLKDLQDDLGLAYLFITHDLSVVEYLADEVAVMYLGRIVEQGRTEELFRHPRHPYTQALLEAIPKPDATGRLRLRLEGDVPSPVRPPAGCPFHPRCPERFGPCAERYPERVFFSPTHVAHCHLYAEEAEERRTDVGSAPERDPDPG